MPAGGFGDPTIKRPRWEIPDDTPEDKVELAQAQHRFAQAVRRELEARDMTEADLERELGIDRHRMVRKLNGTEAMTLRDVIAISGVLGAEILMVLGK